MKYKTTNTFGFRVFSMLLVLVLVMSLSGCGRKNGNVSVTVFAAKSLSSVLNELIADYNREYPDIEIVAVYDSSGTLKNQIEEGAECDLFFSADQKQMDELEGKGFLIENTRENIVNNQVCVITFEGSDTKVSGLKDMDKASSLAIADGSVPVGKYTRQALVNSGILPKTQDISSIRTRDISEAFGGVEINECSSVGAVAASISQGANEVGTVYYSDTFGYEGKLKILEIIPYELTGDVIYPAACVRNPNATREQSEEAKSFLAFMMSDSAKAVFESHHFDICR